MAIAFDAASPDTSSNANVANLTSGSWTIAGSNRVLFGAMAAGAGTVAAHSAMKWGGSGGTGLTQIGSSLNVGANGRVSAWRLIAPTAASQTLYGEYASNQDETMIGGTSYTGVDQTTPVGTPVTNTGTATGSGSTNMTVNVTTVVGDVVVAVFFVLDGNGNSPLLTPNGTPAGTGRYEIEGAQLAFEAMQMQDVVATGTTTTVSCAVAPTSGSLNADWGVIAFVVNAVGGALQVGRADETDSASALDGIDFGQDEDLFTFGDDTGDESSMGGLKLFGGFLATGANGPVGLAQETDTALPLGVARPAGIATETDVAFALAAVQIRAVGIAAETEAALALSGAQLLAVGRSDETDAALALSSGGLTGPVGRADETDTALALAATQIRATGLATETESAIALAALQITATGRADEADTALALLPGGALSVGMAEETDTAFALQGVNAAAVLGGGGFSSISRQWRGESEEDRLKRWERDGLIPRASTVSTPQQIQTEQSIQRATFEAHRARQEAKRAQTEAVAQQRLRQAERFEAIAKRYQAEIDEVRNAHTQEVAEDLRATLQALSIEAAVQAEQIRRQVEEEDVIHVMSALARL